MNKAVQIGQIESTLEAVYTAFCIGCGTDKSSNNEPDTFAKELHAQGWRVSDAGDMFCPICALKRDIK